jgi:phosphoglycolate phosphatase-like HAD superfamily hydrolase/phosphatidylglycerophosphate synthase
MTREYRQEARNGTRPERPARLVLVAEPSPSAQDCSTPLPLVRVAGISVIERLIACAARAGFEVAVAVDDRADEIRRHVRRVSRRRGIPVAVVSSGLMSRGREAAVRVHDAIGEGTLVLLPADHVVSPACFQLIRDLAGCPGTVVLATEGRLAVVSRGDGRARAVPTGAEHWWLPVRTRRDRCIATRRLVQASAKPVDGTLASRINRPLSDVATQALVTWLPAVTSVHVSLLAFALAIAAAAALALGSPVIAAVLIPVAVVLDRTDGHIARVTERPSAFGSYLDPVLDRTSDGLLLLGAGIYLASDDRLAPVAGAVHVQVAIAVSGLALLSHLLVSYTSSKATIEVGHWYEGPLIGSGRGRDRRLLIVSVGAVLAGIDPAALVVSLLAVTAVSTGIVVSRLRWSSWLAGRAAPTVGVRAVALDFDGTIADSMGFLTALAVDLMVDELGLTRSEATDGYIATVGADFTSQLAELCPDLAATVPTALRFEERKAAWMPQCKLFADVPAALAHFQSAGIPVFVCSSSRLPLVADFFHRHGLEDRVSGVDGWTPDDEKACQLARVADASGFRRDEVLYVGDSRRDAEIARAVGTRFVGLIRPGATDAFEGSGEHVIDSLLPLARDVCRAATAPVVTLRGAGRSLGAPHLRRRYARTAPDSRAV